MGNELYAYRDKIREELSEREETLLRLKKEISILEDENNQARIIDEALKSHYEELQKEHYIDRGQESEIENVISSKRESVEDEISLYSIKTDSASRTYNRTIDDLDSKKRWDHRLKQGVFEYSSDFNKRVKPIEKEYDKAAKEAEKQRSASWKAADKNCIDNLKRLFGELEIDIKRFYKKGISADNLNELVNIMDDICDKGSKIGTIPQSYLQKVYKWKQEAAAAPIDEERIDKNKEEEAKKSIKEKLAKARKELKQSQDLLHTKENAISINIEKISELTAKADEKNGRFEADREAIVSEAEEKKKLLIDSYDKDVDKLTKTCEKKKKQNQNRINDLNAAIESLEAEKDTTSKTKQEKEAELAKTFLLSFGKKKDLKEKIEQLDTSIRTISSQIQEKQNVLVSEKKKNIDKELESELKKRKEKQEKDLLDIEKQTAKRIDCLVEIISSFKEQAEKLKSVVSADQESVERLKQTIIDQKDKETKLENEVKDFHTRYIIKTFGKQYGISSMIAEKKKLIKDETSAISSLNKKLLSAEKEIAVFEKEEERRKEELQKELIRAAKEKEEARKQQQERQLRIKEELSSKEKEQEIIKERNVDIDVTELIAELENDPDHILLGEDVYPFEEDNKKTITNSIVRKQLIQRKETPDCGEYLLMFADAAGNIISDKRLVKQMPVGEQTTVSFELKSSSGFNKNNYYFIVQNFSNGNIISAVKYKINISFSNDFDF